jgi:transcriptional regulator NrdR family protein
MWGITIYLMVLADYLTGRKQKSKKRRTCDVCEQIFPSIEEMEKHRRDIHPNMPPRRTEA